MADKIKEMFSITFNKGNNLMIIRGITLNDLAEREIKVNTPEVQMKVSVLSEIPSRFTGINQWPTFTNLKCWNCDLLPDDYPKFIPLNPTKKSGNYQCDVRGNFCEWSCVIAFILREYPIEQQWDLINIVYIIAAEFTGQMKKIKPSYSKLEMKSYCGKKGMDLYDWKQKIKSLNE